MQLSSPSTVPLGKTSFLSAFKYRNFRYLWFSTVGTGSTSAMETLLVGWLVLQLTNSPALVGIVSACRYAGMALGPVFGALADRFDRRQILITVRAAAALVALLLSVLIFTSLIQLWEIVVLVLLNSLLWSFNQTTFSALAGEVVEGPHLASSVSLLIVGLSGMRTIGSLVAGFLYDSIGSQGCFGLISIVYVSTSLLMLPLRLPESGGKVREPVLRSFMDGLRYIVSTRGVAAMVLFAAIANLFIFPATFDTLAVFVKSVLNSNATGLGLILGAESLGSLIGSLICSSLGKSQRKGSLTAILMLTWPFLVAGFTLSHTVFVAVLIMALAGVGRGLAMSLIQVLMLVWSPAKYAGRVMGVRMSVIVMEMVGSMIMGALAGLWGIAIVMRVSALLSIVASFMTVLWAPQLRQKDQTTPISRSAQ